MGLPLRLFAFASLAVTAACAPMRAPEPAALSGERPTLGVEEIPPPAWAESQIHPVSPEVIAAPGSSLAAFLGEALRHNPGLRAAWQDYEAALQRVPQVTSLSDPMLTATLPIEEVQTRTGPQEFALGVQQRFPWFGVLDARGRAAVERAEEMRLEHRRAALDLTRRAQGLWWEAAFQRTLRELASEELTLLEGFAEIAASRYATGQGPQQAVLRAEVELSRVQEQVIAIEERVDSLRVELNTLADRPAEALLALPTLSEKTARLIEVRTDALLASAEAIRPELQALRHRLARQAHERQLAQSRARPEMMIGANWIAVGQRPDAGADPPGEGDDVTNVVIGATLPIWTRANRAAVSEVDRATEATHLRLRDTHNRVAQEIHLALLRMREALDLMELQATALIPQAEQTLAATEAAFRTGQTSMLDLIDAERVLLRLRAAHERARRDHLLALADLERAVGAALVEEK